MSAMTRFTLRSLGANRVRTLVTVAGVALAAALLTAVLTSYTSLENFLYRDEVQRNGLWTAQVRVPDADDALAAAEAEDVTATALLTDVGFVANDERAQKRYGRYLPVIALDGDAEALCAVRPSEGRMPAAADEVMLPEGYRHLLAADAGSAAEGGDPAAAEAPAAGEGAAARPLALGDVVTLDLGQREVSVAGGGSAAPSAAANAFSMGAPTLQDGMRLDSDTALVTADSSVDGSAAEHLVDVQQRSLTVVGFYDHANNATVTSFGTVALTGPDPQAAGTTALYMVVDGVGSADQMEERVEALFPGVPSYLHGDLLRAMGMRSETGIWDTFYAMVCVLAVVIVVACISLIYNAFAISVAERTRQFGLLASIGASQRQIRRAVLLEALVVAAIGVPVGIGLGLGGAALVFAMLGPSISQMLVGSPDFMLCVKPSAVAFAAGLSLVTVLVSAWIPARRASRASAVDALRRAADVRMPRRARRAAAKSSAVHHPWKRRSLSGRVFGLGGQMATINAKRGSARGRTASTSLALAVVLLMTAGSLTTHLSVLVNVTGVQSIDHDIEVNGFSSLSDGAAALDASRAIYERMATVDGVEPRGFSVSEGMPLIVPEAMAGSAFTSDDSHSAGKVASGSYGVNGLVVGLDDDDFAAYAAAAGADAGLFADPQAPRAIAMGSMSANNGESYLYFDTFTRPGTVEAVTGGTYEGAPLLGMGSYNVMQPDGNRDFRLQGIASNDPTGEGVPFDELALTMVPVEVAAVTEECPALYPNAYSPTLVVPASMMEPWGLMGSFSYDQISFRAAFDAEDHEAATEALQDVAGEMEDSLGSVGESYLNVQDRRAAIDNMNALVMVVNVFCLLFTVILTLIALANVFNTITNGLILRRREFAVMKSAGMGNRTFRAMIAAECARYSLRGLIPGLLVSLLVSFALYQAMAVSVKGFAFTIPWGYMGLSVALVAVALLLSVAYGLHRCKANNVVEALRDIA